MLLLLRLLGAILGGKDVHYRLPCWGPRWGQQGPILLLLLPPLVQRHIWSCAGGQRWLRCGPLRMWCKLQGIPFLHGADTQRWHSHRPLHCHYQVRRVLLLWQGADVGCRPGPQGHRGCVLLEGSFLGGAGLRSPSGRRHAQRQQRRMVLHAAVVPAHAAISDCCSCVGTLWVLLFSCSRREYEAAHWDTCPAPAAVTPPAACLGSQASPASLQGRTPDARGSSSLDAAPRRLAGTLWRSVPAGSRRSTGLAPKPLKSPAAIPPLPAGGRNPYK